MRHLHTKFRESTTYYIQNYLRSKKPGANRVKVVFHLHGSGKDPHSHLLYAILTFKSLRNNLKRLRKIFKSCFNLFTIFLENVLYH